MTIEVLGTGCMKCKRLLKNVEKAVEETKTEAEIIKIEDINEIMDRGVMLTPGLIINGELIVSGRVADVKEISGYLLE
ncbi:thioredoxin family protein [Methanogenium organophilum]|uniref:Thioredoxin n=1 Tax=Methanogenium organophilum TaxID=2199 RepID=A0A9X9T9Z4_METOG|nr:thioredoxin family protein [Methanogenium organophilum]WAI02577.1 thioredoxin family protein [Methanogenium organophilum]